MSFQSSLEKIFLAEGRTYTNRATDRGGPTKFGVTLATLKAYRGKPVSAEDVKALTEEEATQIYRKLYWDELLLDQVKNTMLQDLLFDQGVNRGVGTAGRYAQTVLNEMGANLVVDGAVGPKTIAALNIANPVRFLIKFVCLAQDKYIAIAKADPSQMDYIAGWINRTQALLELLLAYNQ